MDSLKYKIQSGDIAVQIKRASFNLDIVTSEKDAIKVYDDEISKLNTLVEISVEDYLKIYYFFEEFSSGLNDLNILVIPETNTILVGGKRKSFSVKLSNGIVTNEFVHCLFWDFELLENGYVLETGELDCLLRDKNGNIIAKVPVDPPWESTYEEDGIRFSSIVYGEQFLMYPDRSSKC